MSRTNIISAISWTLGLAVIYFSVGSLVDGKNIEQMPQNQSICKTLVSKILDTRSEGEKVFSGGNWTNNCVFSKH